MHLAQPLGGLLSVHFARFRVTQIADSPDSHDQFATQPMLDAAQLLADARVGAILWSGTSGAWEGFDADRRLVATVRASTGIPATTATLALLDGFRELKVRTYGLVVPYVEPIVTGIVRNFEAAGYACVARTNESLTVNWDFAAIPSATIEARIRTVARSGPDAIVVHCTNLRGAEVSEELERELGIPILDSVVVGLWGALRLLEIAVPPVGFGRLAVGSAPGGRAGDG